MGRALPKLLTISAVAAIAAALWLPGTRAQEGAAGEAQAKAEYVGEKNCRKCHFKQYKAWKGHEHSKAWDVLKDEAKAKPDCFKCHVTGYGEPSGFVSADKTPHLTDVQCEQCHGPGSVHAALAKENKDKMDDPKIEKLVKGAITHTPTNCASCHKVHEKHPEMK